MITVLNRGKILSAKAFQAVKGMNDILPTQTPYWDYLETVLRHIVSCYGYQEIRFPLVEQTQLFERTIGAATDVVEKEMYTFDDHGESLTLRPEGTAGCVRAAIEHGLLYNQIQRLWYNGPMFRREKPQKGRYRQFHQFGVEAFGMPGPDIDAEQIFMVARIWQELGIKDQVSLQLNSLGSAETRAEHRHKLVTYFTAHENQLDEDSRRRLVTNPLRILDSKNPRMQDLIADAPKVTDYLDARSQNHLDGLRRLLEDAGIAYELNPRLVRGLDYYGLTVYEWVGKHESAQNTVCAGGRYDALTMHLGGEATPAVGFAIGLERLVSLLDVVYSPPQSINAYLILVGDAAIHKGLLIAEQLRAGLPQLKLQVNCGAGSFKSQFKRADKSGATWALIIADDELAQNKIALKNLREEQPQQNLTLSEIMEFFRKRDR